MFSLSFYLHLSLFLSSSLSLTWLPTTNISNNVVAIFYSSTKSISNNNRVSCQHLCAFPVAIVTGYRAEDRGHGKRTGKGSWRRDCAYPVNGEVLLLLLLLSLLLLARHKRCEVAASHKISNFMHLNNWVEYCGGLTFSWHCIAMGRKGVGVLHKLLILFQAKNVVARWQQERQQLDLVSAKSQFGQHFKLSIEHFMRQDSYSLLASSTCPNYINCIGSLRL